MSMVSTVKRSLRRFMGIDNELDEQIIGTYFNLRICMGVLALLLPIALCIGGQRGWWLEEPLPLQNSLSAYYHAIPNNNCLLSKPGVYRDLFVGILSAISACLIAYKGYTAKEDWLLNAGGFFLVLVAFFPMGWPPMENGCKDAKGMILDIKGSLLFGIPGLQIHFVSAVIFFVVLIATVIFTSKSTLDRKEMVTPRVLLTEQQSHKRNQAQRTHALLKRWRLAYNTLSVLMLTPLVIVIIGRAIIPTWYAYVLWSELTGIIFFAIYWFMKTLEVWQTKVDVDPKN